MKLIKAIGLAVLSGIAMTALVAPASATIATSPAGTLYTGTVAATNEGKLTLHASNGLTAETEGELAGKIESHGASTTTTIKLTALPFSVGGVVHVKKLGHLTIHSLIPPSVTWDGGEIEVTFSAGVTCVFSTSNTPIGSLTTSKITGGKATLDINSASLPRTGGSILCGSTGTWTGSLIFNSPSSLNID